MFTSGATAREGFPLPSMNADNAAGTGTGNRRRSLPSNRTAEQYSPGRPASALRRAKARRSRDRASASESTSPKLGNLAASFPLLFFGAGCLAAAAFVLLDGTGAAIGRIPLWLPFFALGTIALVGGTLSVFAEPDETEEIEEANEDFEVEEVPRAVSLSMSRAVSPEPGVQLRTETRAAPPPVPPSEEARSSVRPPARADDSLISPSTHSPGSEPVPPASAGAGTLLPDDASALLREIDLITADLRANRRPTRTTPTRGFAGRGLPTTTQPVAGAMVGPLPVQAGAAQLTPATPERLESEAPRQSVHCVGCGSVILRSGTPSRCQVCGEPLCSDCRDRSYAEGKPNLCPLCHLLDSVHSRGSPSPQPTRSRI
jgi:hypothetical protein